MQLVVYDTFMVTIFTWNLRIKISLKKNKNVKLFKLSAPAGLVC